MRPPGCGAGGRLRAGVKVRGLNGGCEVKAPPWQWEQSNRLRALQPNRLLVLQISCLRALQINGLRTLQTNWLLALQIHGLLILQTNGFRTLQTTWLSALQTNRLLVLQIQGLRAPQPPRLPIPHRPHPGDQDGLGPPRAAHHPAAPLPEAPITAFLVYFLTLFFFFFNTCPLLCPAAARGGLLKPLNASSGCLPASSPANKALFYQPLPAACSARPDRGLPSHRGTPGTPPGPPKAPGGARAGQPSLIRARFHPPRPRGPMAPPPTCGAGAAPVPRAGSLWGPRGSPPVRARPL